MNKHELYPLNSTEHSPSLGFSWDGGVRVEALRSATAFVHFRAAFWGAGGINDGFLRIEKERMRKGEKDF